jgi:hypothetical protein
VFTRPLLIALVPVLVCGCVSHGFDRAAIQERLHDGTLQVTDEAIAEARSTRAQLRFPCRVAVYFKPAEHGGWWWAPEDKAALEPWAAALKHEGIASEVFPLPDMLTGKGDAKELRLAAAKCGADVLLVIRGVAQTDSYQNPAAMLYLTGVGGFLVPGSHRDSLFVMEGCLIDVDNGYVYTGVQAEGVGKIIRPTFLIEDRDAIARARAKAVGQFGEEFLRRMRALACACPAPAAAALPPPGEPKK